MDNLKKRMLIGDSLGYIGIYNTTNGAKIKNLPKHSGEVLHIVHAQNVRGAKDTKDIEGDNKELDAFFITAGMDNKIHMTKDNDFGENELIRTLEITKEVMISCLSFHP